ncbi:hypothetical protein Vafri_19379 [Volvox africanus]|uniref:SBP-type domain-containing protein n=1 Tax=Volvox africanus TaxID=51714 RepID=A0A8J4BN47_9CHLO|nr:hypothetical protein Vafri_19379 [Volvox africanus]
MSTDEGPRGPSKAAWDSTAYIMDTYLGLARGQDARKTGEESRHAARHAEATLLPKKSRKATRPAICQVDGCGRDLSGEKAYLQRYSVCDMHFKADVAMVQGQEMRFCQQCNKFQDLREFEGVRRSCAARSKDRNLRRRLHTTLQKGGASEELHVPAAAVLTQPPPQQQLQSGSPGRSGCKVGRTDAAGSDDSGGQAGSGHASMGGSAAMARVPAEGGMGDSEYSLDAMGAASLAVSGGARRGGQPASACGLQSRNPAITILMNPQQRQHQPAGSAGNGCGASSGNPAAGALEPAGNRPGAWLSLEQMGQSYDADTGLSPSLAVALARRGAPVGDIGAGDMGGAASGGGSGPALMDLDGFLSASCSNPCGPHGGRMQQAVGPLASALALDGGVGTAVMREQDSVYARKMSAVGGAADIAGGIGGWAGPAALSLLDVYDSLRPQQQQQNMHQATPPLQHPPHHSSAAVQRGLQVAGGTSGGSVQGSWGSGAMHRLQSFGADGGGGGIGGQQQLTLGPASDDGGGAMLLGQLHGTVTGVGGRGLAASRDDGSLAGLLGQGALRAGGGGSSLAGMRTDQVEGSRGAVASPGRVLLQQQQQQAGAMPALLSVPSNPRHDDLTAMIKERRAALIRQQLLQQQHRQQQQPLTGQHESLVKQDQTPMLGQSYSGEGPYLSLSASDQLQLRMLSAGGGSASGAPTSGAAAAAAAGGGLVDDYYDIIPAFGSRAGGAGGGLSASESLGGGRNLVAGVMGGASAGGSVPLAAAEALAIGRRQASADSTLDTVQLLEQYALAGGANGTLGRHSSGVNGVHLGVGSGAGSRGLQQQHSMANGAGGSSGDGGGGFSRYDSIDAGAVGAGGGAGGFAAHGTGNGVEGGGSSRLLSVLFPGAGGREDALAARVCLKLFSCTPDELPTDMLIRLRRWAMAAESDVMQIFMRPGCVHLIINMRLSQGGQATLERSVLGGGDLDAAVKALRGAFESCGVLRGRRVVVQAAEGPRGAFEYDGAAGGQARWVSDTDLARAPSVLAVQPAALPCGVSSEVALVGRNLRRPGIRIYARFGSWSYVLHPTARQPGVTAAAGQRDDVGAAEAAEPQLCSPRITPAEEAARGSWTDGVSTPSAPSSLLGGGCGAGEDAAPLLYGESDGFVSSCPSSSSACAARSAGDSASGLLLAEAAATSLAAPEVRRGRLRQQTQAAMEAGVEPQPPQRNNCYGSCLEVVYVTVPALPKQGLVAVEAVSTDVDVMGAWAPGVVCQNAAAAAELNTWLRNNADVMSGQWLLKELGLLLDYDAVLQSLLQDTSGPAFAARPQHGEGLTAAQDVGSMAGLGPAMSGRGSHQRALQQKHAASNTQQQQQQRQQQQLLQQPVMPVISNPLPRTGADRSGMAVAAAAAGNGALSAVPYSASEASDLPPIVSARPDGSLELRLLPSDTSADLARTRMAQGPGPAGHAGGSSTARDPQRGLRHGDVQSALLTSPHATMGSAADGGCRVGPRAAPNRVTLSDDTKVPDTPGRLLEPSLRRLLAHPLLHQGCRRAMLTAGSRLLAFAVASGLSLLANGLVEWLMVLEAPTLGLVAGGGPFSAMATTADGAGVRPLETEPVTRSILADTFGRVVGVAAVGTVRGAVLGASRAFGSGSGASSGGASAAGSALCETFPENDSSHDSSIGSSSNGMFRNLSMGLSLLHLAVISCSSVMLMQVLDWAEEYGRPWALEEQAWPGRVTALHLAAAAGALRGDGGEAARLLLSLGPEAQNAWLESRDALGRTPADIAHAVGLGELNYFCLRGEEPPTPRTSDAARSVAVEGGLAPGSKGGRVIAYCSATTEVVDLKARAAASARSLEAAPDLWTVEDIGRARLPAPSHRSAALLGTPLLLGALLVLLAAGALGALQVMGASVGAAGMRRH